MYHFTDWEQGRTPPKGWDVADAVRDGWDKAQIEALMRVTVQPWSPASAQERGNNGPSRSAAPLPRQDDPRPAAEPSCGDPGDMRPFHPDAPNDDPGPAPSPAPSIEARAVFYYRLTYGRGFPLVLGYFHRVREYVERLEAKHSLAGKQV